MSTATDDRPQHKRVLEYTRRTAKIHVGRKQFVKLTSDDSYVMRMARGYHYELTSIGLLVNDAFAIQVLVSMCVAFVSITSVLYRTSSLLLWASLRQEGFEKGLGISVSWLVFTSYRVVAVVSACAKASDTAAATAIVICHLHEPAAKKAYRDEISNFTLQLSQYSLTFTALGCIILNYRLIHKMVNSITMYLIILVQIGKVLASDLFTNATSPSDLTQM